MSRPSYPIEYYINENGCHICTSHETKFYHGYCRIQVNKTKYRLHRYIYEQTYGKIPEGLVVRHKCDVRNCINPDHLELGTNWDNTQDMIKRNRHCINSDKRKPSFRFSSDSISEIRASNLPINTIAKQFDVSWDTIKNIKTFKTYKNWK